MKNPRGRNILCVALGLASAVAAFSPREALAGAVVIGNCSSDKNAMKATVSLTDKNTIQLSLTDVPFMGNRLETLNFENDSRLENDHVTIELARLPGYSQYQAKVRLSSLLHFDLNCDLRGAPESFRRDVLDWIPRLEDEERSPSASLRLDHGQSQRELPSSGSEQKLGPTSVGAER